MAKRKLSRTPLKRLAEESGVSINTLYSRLRAGVPMEDLLVPRRESRGGKSYEKLIAEAGLKLTKQGLSLRLKKGDVPERSPFNAAQKGETGHVWPAIGGNCQGRRHALGRAPQAAESRDVRGGGGGFLA